MASREKVLPIKDKETLEKVKNVLLNDFKAGRRNLTLFQVGKGTLLRVSDVVRLKICDVYDDFGNVKDDVYINDKKTGKRNVLYLKPVKSDLLAYYPWLKQQGLENLKWLFPSIKHPDQHIAENQFYRIMQKVGELLDLDYMGTHTMRKTGAYLVYKQTGDIALVMDLLNHSSQKTTLRYLGLDVETKRQKLDTVNFG